MPKINRQYNIFTLCLESLPEKYGGKI